MEAAPVPDAHSTSSRVSPPVPTISDADRALLSELLRSGAFAEELGRIDCEDAGLGTS